jgi:hypothetical protein
VKGTVATTHPVASERAVDIGEVTAALVCLWASNAIRARSRIEQVAFRATWME